MDRAASAASVRPLDILRELATACATPCMYNAAYIGPIEKHECYTALGEELDLGGGDLDAAADFLSGECRPRAQRGARFCYPDMLPVKPLAKEQEAGIIDSVLSLPLEDPWFEGRRGKSDRICGVGAALNYAADDRGQRG